MSVCHPCLHVGLGETIDMEERLAHAHSRDVHEHAKVRRETEAVRMEDAVAVHERHVRHCLCAFM